MTYSAGTVFLQVVPSYDNFQRSLRKESLAAGKAFEDDFTKSSERAGTRAGKVLGTELSKEVSKAADKAGKDSGEKYTGAFRDAVKRGVAGVEKELKGIRVDSIIGDDALKQLPRVRDRLRELKRQAGDIKVDLDAAGTLREIETIQTALKIMQSNATNVEVRANAGAALAEIETVRARLEHLDRMTIEPEIKIDRQLGAFERKLRSGIDKALGDLPPVDLEVDNSAVTRAIAEVRSEMYALRDAHIGVDLDSGAAMARIAEIQVALEGIDHNTTDLQVSMDTAAAMGKLALLQREVSRIDGDAINIPVDVDAGAAIAQMGMLKTMMASAGHGTDNAANSFRAFNIAILAAVTLGPMLIPILAALAGGAAALGVAIGGLVGGLGVMAIGLSGIMPAVQALGKVHDKAGKDTAAAAKTMRGAANGVRDAEQALSRARQDAARSQSAAGRQLADAERGLARARQDASRSTADAARRVADARRNLADAERKASDEIARAQRSEADARRNLTRTTEDVARRNASALEGIKRAERQVADAQRASTKAQEDLARARAKAAQDIIDANYEARGAALAQQEAALRLADAQKAYNRVMGRDFKSARSVQDVTLALQEAQLAYDEAQTKNQRAAAEAADANQKGVDGADAVVQATQGVADATQNVTDAQTELKAAQADATQTQIDGAQQIADAQRGVTDAVKETRDTRRQAARDIADAERSVTSALLEQTRTQQDNAQRIADANRSIADAQRQAAEAARAGQQGIADATQRLADAQASYREAVVSTGVLGSAAMQNLETAMGKLSPAGQRFARFIYGLKDEFYGLRAAIQEGMLPGLQDGLQHIIDVYGPGLLSFAKVMSKTLGGIFREVGNVLTGPVFREFFGTLADLGPRFMRDFATTTLNWLQVFARLMTLSAPLALQLSGALLRLSDDVLKWTTSAKGTKTWQDFMGYVARVGPMVWDFFKNLGGALLNIGRAVAPYAETVLRLFSGLLGFIAGLNPQLLGMIVIGVLGLVVAFQAATGATALMSGAVSIFGKTAEGAFKNPLGIAIFLLVALVTALILAYQRSETFRNVVNAALDGVKVAFGLMAEGIQWAWENVLSPTWDAIMSGAKWLWEKVLSPIWTLMKKGWGDLVDEFKWAWDNVLKPVWDAVSTAAQWLWSKVLSPVFGFIGSAWSTLASAIKWVWDNIWFPVIDLVGTIIWNLWKLELKVAFEAIVLAWRALADTFKWAWENVIKPVWSALGSTVTWVWDHVLHPMFDTFMDVIGNQLVDAFQSAVGLIGKAWDGIKDLAKAPIKFMIDTVINDGFIGTFNKIAGFFGTKEMGRIPLPKGFATGGYTGPGGRFEPAGIVHRDEYVISSPARRAFESMHPGALDAINSTGRMPGYAKGGVVKPVKGPFGLPFGNTYSDGSFHSGQDFPVPTGTQVVAALAGVVKTVMHLATSYGNHVVIKHPGGSETLYAHLSTTGGTHPGEVVGAGTGIGLSGATGHVTGPHLHFEFRTPPGGYSNAINPLGILSGASNPDGDTGFFPDWLAHPFTFLKDKVTGLLGKMGDNPFTHLIGEMPMSLLGMAKDGIGSLAKGALGKVGSAASGAWDFVNGPFGGRGPLPDNGTAMYDNGGYLPPGLTTVVNATGKPEPVFTSGQWDSLQSAGTSANSAPGLSFGDLYAVDPEDAVRQIRTSQSDAAAVHNLRSIASGV